jgi:predicted lactoylglutathione lyase
MIADHIYAMLLTHAKFKEFTQVLTCLAEGRSPAAI